MANVSVNEACLLCVPTVHDIDWEQVYYNGLTVDQIDIIKSTQVILAAGKDFGYSFLYSHMFLLLTVIVYYSGCGNYFFCSLRYPLIWINQKSYFMIDLLVKTNFTSQIKISLQ